ncbi:hydrolase [Nocardioides sp. BGMRC 2183]|nr:hydrolase [Nocardioides sp. BGMRC 2183]
MTLTTAQTDRAAGVLLASAAGDALGVPYEFNHPPSAAELAEMKGGGLGNFAPGEWSDDTSMAIAIAEVAATGADLTSAEALDAIASGFLRWFNDGPPDIGIQTSAVLNGTAALAAPDMPGIAEVMRREAAAYSRQHPHSAGNGALMRTAAVALAHLDDRERLARAARLISELTHADPLAGDSCVLWCEAIRVAVGEARIQVTAGLDLLPDERREQWASWLKEAQTRPAGDFRPNGFTVVALQAAVAAITSTSLGEPFECLHLQDALHAAVRIGDDTDTVAAVAGGLLGARWGASAVPWRWRRAVHGWPGLDGRDLVSLATLAASGGMSDGLGWPVSDVVEYEVQVSAASAPHPHDEGVLLGTHASHAHNATAIVAACRIGRQQPTFGRAQVVVESRLIDSDDHADNPNLEFLLYDAADAIRGLRSEGHMVLLHCVAAEQRTPSIAVAYSILLGHDVEDARRVIQSSLPSTRGRGSVWDAVGRLSLSTTGEHPNSPTPGGRHGDNEPTKPQCQPENHDV